MITSIYVLILFQKPLTIIKQLQRNSIKLIPHIILQTVQYLTFQPRIISFVLPLNHVQTLKSKSVQMVLCAHLTSPISKIV
jgi:hypothetical protein